MMWDVGDFRVYGRILVKLRKNKKRKERY